MTTASSPEGLSDLELNLLIQSAITERDRRVALEVERQELQAIQDRTAAFRRYDREDGDDWLPTDLGSSYRVGEVVHCLDCTKFHRSTHPYNMTKPCLGEGWESVYFVGHGEFSEAEPIPTGAPLAEWDTWAHYAPGVHVLAFEREWVSRDWIRPGEAPATHPNWELVSEPEPEGPEPEPDDPEL